MAGGADAGYIFEEKFGITELKRDLDSMISKMDKKMVYRYILDLNLLMVYVSFLGDSYWSMRRPMKTTIQNSSVGTSQPKSSCLYISLKSVFVRMYCEEGRDKFTVRQNVLGHMQQVKPLMSIATVHS